MNDEWLTVYRSKATSRQYGTQAYHATPKCDKIKRAKRIRSITLCAATVSGRQPCTFCNPPVLEALNDNRS